jgi:hypothetical protein
MRSGVFIVAVAALMLSAPALKAADPKPGGGEPSPEKTMAMEEGIWDGEVTVTLPGAEPVKSKCVETNQMLGGKWLISEFKGEFFGSRFEGNGQNGYDAKKGKYVASWVDSVSSKILLLEGSYDEKTKTLTLHADAEDPAGNPMKLRLETQFKDDGTRVFTEYVQADGQKDFAKFMEIKYTKRKK